MNKQHDDICFDVHENAFRELEGYFILANMTDISEDFVEKVEVDNWGFFQFLGDIIDLLNDDLLTSFKATANL